LLEQNSSQIRTYIYLGKSQKINLLKENDLFHDDGLDVEIYIPPVVLEIEESILSPIPSPPPVNDDPACRGINIDHIRYFFAQNDQNKLTTGFKNLVREGLRFGADLITKGLKKWPCERNMGGYLEKNPMGRYVSFF